MKAPLTMLLQLQVWEFEEIALEPGGFVLGFSIAGGVANPHVGNGSLIYMTKFSQK